MVGGFGELWIASFLARKLGKCGEVVSGVFWSCRGMGWRDVRSVGVCRLDIMELGIRKELFWRM